jgi:hypothetical protein
MYHELEIVFSFGDQILLSSDLLFELWKFWANAFFKLTFKANHLFPKLSKTDKLLETVL